MTRRRPNQKAARTQKVLPFDAKHFDRYLEHAREVTGEGLVSEGHTDEERSWLMRVWPIKATSPRDAIQARAKSRKHNS